MGRRSSGSGPLTLDTPPTRGQLGRLLEVVVRDQGAAIEILAQLPKGEGTLVVCDLLALARDLADAGAEAAVFQLDQMRRDFRWP